MRHNQHIIRLPLTSLPPRLLPKLTPMVLLPKLTYKRIQSFRHVFRAFTALAPVAPNVPVFAEAAVFAGLADLRGRFAFVVAVVPFANGLGDLYVCVCAWGETCGRVGFGPGVAGAAAEVEEFEGALGAGAWGDVTIMPTALAHQSDFLFLEGSVGNLGRTYAPGSPAQSIYRRPRALSPLRVCASRRLR